MPYRVGEVLHRRYIDLTLTDVQQDELRRWIDEQNRLLAGDPTYEECEEAYAVLERARIIELAHNGWVIPLIVEEVRWTKQRVCRLLKSFQERGFDVLTRKPGRPPQPEHCMEIVADLLLLRDNLELKTPKEYLDAINEWVEPKLALPTLRRYLRQAGIHFRGKRS
jgi:hypothetical protein